MRRGVNPRGLRRPQNGQGGVRGMAGGRRMGRNIGGCRNGGPGRGLNGGRGGGRNRRG